MITFNFPGLVLLLVGAGASFLVAAVSGREPDAAGMMCAGPVVAVLDLVYRARWGERRWFHPHYGGSLYHLPCWLFGVAWFTVGAYYLATGRA
jgi:hypothetical protein